MDDKAETDVHSDESRDTALVPLKHPEFASETVQVRVAQIKSFFGDRFAEPFHSVAQVTESNSTDSTPVSSSLSLATLACPSDAGGKTENQEPHEDTKEAAAIASTTPSTVSQFPFTIHHRN